MFSGILIVSIRITFDKEKRGCVWHLQVFSFDIRITFDKEKRGCVWHLQVFSFDIRITFDKEKRGCVWHLQVLSFDIWITFNKEKGGCVWHLQVFSFDIRITFDKKKQGHIWCLQVFLSWFESPSTKRNEDVYDIFRYSHRHSNHLRQRETRMCMTSSGILIQYSNYLRQKETRTYIMSSGILIIIWITFDKEKRGCVWHLQVFSSTFESHSTKRNEDVYDIFRYSNSIFESPSTKRNEDIYAVFRYSYHYLNHLRQRETRMCMTSSGILIDIGIIFDKEKWGHVWCSQVFLLTFEFPW